MGYVYKLQAVDIESMCRKAWLVYVPENEEGVFLESHGHSQYVGRWEYPAALFERVASRKPRNVQRWTD